MDVYKVSLTAPAEEDLRDIARYISAQFHEPNTALNMVRAIREKIDTLETMALSYPLIRDDRLAALGYRWLKVKNYTAFYVVNEKEKTVDVDRILYSRRDWQNIL